MWKKNGQSRQNTCRIQLVKTDFALFMSLLLIQEWRHFLIEMALKKCCSRKLIISTNGNTSFSGQRRYAPSRAGLEGKPRLIQEVTTGLQRQPLDRLRLSSPAVSGYSPSSTNTYLHNQPFETSVNDHAIRSRRIWSPTHIFKVFKPF